VALGKNQAAQDLLAAALKKNPKDTVALFQRGGLSLRSGKVEEAEKDLQEILRANPDFAEAHSAMAEVDKAKGMTLSERQELTEALKLNPALLPARLMLARNLIQANESKSALDLLNSAPGGQKGTLAFVIERNWALLGVGDTKELRSALDQALRVRRVPELVIQDGVLRLKQADYSGVIADAEEAIKDNDVRGVRLLAGAYLALKQPAKAEARLNALVAANPKSATLANVVGMWYLNSGNLSGARQAFESALNADPKFLDAGLALAGIDVEEKHWDAARQRLAWVIAANPTNVGALLMLGGVAEEVGDQAEALRRYREAFALDNSNVGALNGLAYALAASQQTDEALNYAQKAVELAPDDASVNDTLGWIYYKKAVYPTAIRYLETAVAKGPTARREFHLAMSYLKSGQRDVGSKKLQAALQRDPNLPVTEKGW
jgi:tetratricopeptide (TPR) repeat protein